jgi:hypothetical protein
MPEYLVVVLIVGAAVAALIYVIARPNPYSSMTEEEFEEDAKRGSALGTAVLGVERILRRREADYLIEEKLRVDKNAASVGGEPPEDYSPLDETSKRAQER